MSQSLIIGYPNRADGATISAGSWEPTLPAANMADAEVPKVARSTDATLASTVFNIDLGSTQLLRAFALANHNLSAAATWRIMLGSTAGASDIYDSGQLAAWTMAFNDIVEWESASWWLGVAGDEYLRSPYPALFAAPDAYSARHIRIEITDTSNVDGYVQIGRFFAGGAIQPTYGMSWGLQNRQRDLSTIDRAESGAMWATKRRVLRSTSFELNWLTPTEASYIHEMQRVVGTTGEVLWLPYPDDLGESQRYGMLGTLSELSPIEHPFFNNRSLALRIEEVA
jgi:hypothetical protein